MFVHERVVQEHDDARPQARAYPRNDVFRVGELSVVRAVRPVDGVEPVLGLDLLRILSTALAVRESKPTNLVSDDRFELPLASPDFVCEEPIVERRLSIVRIKVRANLVAAPPRLADEIWMSSGAFAHHEERGASAGAI